ncbi:hypothetical protein VTI28DRAFT_10361 [Corynascus sepedonium]
MRYPNSRTPEFCRPMGQARIVAERGEEFSASDVDMSASEFLLRPVSLECLQYFEGKTYSSICQDKQLGDNMAFERHSR